MVRLVAEYEGEAVFGRAYDDDFAVRGFGKFQGGLYASHFEELVAEAGVYDVVGAGFAFGSDAFALGFTFLLVKTELVGKGFLFLLELVLDGALYLLGQYDGADEDSGGVDIVELEYFFGFCADCHFNFGPFSGIYLFGGISAHDLPDGGSYFGDDQDAYIIVGKFFVYVADLVGHGVVADGDIDVNGESVLVENVHVFFACGFIDAVYIDFIPGRFYMEALGDDIFLVEADAKFIECHSTFGCTDRVEDAGGYAQEDEEGDD